MARSDGVGNVGVSQGFQGIEMKQGIAAKSSDTSILENMLRNTTVGQTVTYEQMSTALGRDVREYCRGNINTARRTLEKESIFFDVVRGDGLVRVDGNGAMGLVDSTIRKAKRQALHGKRILMHVEYEELQDDQKKKHLSMSAQLGAIELFASSKAAKKIESKVNGSQPIAIGETLKLFGG